jgi:enoyl-CoA hydratase/carnithine racemase
LAACALLAVARCRHPVIAMIKGACVGGGLEIAAMCDMRICGEASRFGVPIKNLGLTMGYGELQGVLALVGRAVALEILLEGRVFDAAEALHKRLVNRVVADADVEREAYALAGRIATLLPARARAPAGRGRRCRRSPSSEPDRSCGTCCGSSCSSSGSGC